MNNKELKNILRIIKDKETDILTMKDFTHLIGKNHLYVQGFLQALEGVGLIKLEFKATMKRIKLTEKGNDFLER